MKLSFLFWLLMLFALFAGGVPYFRRGETPVNYFGVVGGFLMFCILALLGYAVFGSPLKGG